MKAATAVIADDEPRLARYLRERLAVVWPELVIAGVAANGPEARALIAAEAPDIAFLDIRMPGFSGLDVARDLAGVHVVFVTAHDEYALAAFDRAAVDYLLKPVGDERLAEAVRRLQDRLTATPRMPATGDVAQALALLRAHFGVGSSPPGAERLAWIRAAAGSQVRLIAVDDVCYFEANDKYTSVFTADGEALIRTSLRELAAQLDGERFWQIHRGTIVNVAHVATTTRDLAGRVSVRLKTRPETLAVSRAYAHLFRQM
ncbi:MAG: response regulator transcription factor [Burkholderiales bacterium]|nr:response regulator transcription factor [Burkholderiales bacterium]